MRERREKKVNQTFSLSADLSRDLHTFVKKREMSRFVCDAIRNELDIRKAALRDAYLAANKDEGQMEALEDWSTTMEDGLDAW